MAVKVTLEFENVDAAIVGLSKLVGTGKAVVHAQKADAAGSVALSQPSKRRGRSDKGQPRGSYKVDATPMTATQVLADEKAYIAEQGAKVNDAANAIVQPFADKALAILQTAAPQEASPVTPTESPAVAAATTDKDAQAAVSKLFEAKGLQIALQVLSRFGARVVRELKPTQYAEFVQKVNDVLNGGEV